MNKKVLNAKIAIDVNKLAEEKSPYLQQHANNPVKWFPWGEEAFFLAKQQDRPLFISIGYSTCHWCHVMEDESFSDPEIARIFNAYFICIKIDREERPDLDAYFMKAAQLLGCQGGWPLNLLLTPEGQPFYAATYLPPEDRWNLKGLKKLLPELALQWNESHKELRGLSDQVIEAVQKPLKESKEFLFNYERYKKQALDESHASFDASFGGFSFQNKFPVPHRLMWILRSEEQDHQEMVFKTLNHILSGGIHDHLGGGFHRYSVDRRWDVPHFEKMLYDQGMMIFALCDAFQVNPQTRYEEGIRSTIKYVQRDLKTSNELFYSAEDADSEGVEGKFYSWTPKQIQTLLSKEDAILAMAYFNVSLAGDFDGLSVLKNPLDEQYYAREVGVPVNQLISKIKGIKEELFNHRELRIRPHRDEKVLLDWNGLMIGAMARASYVLEDEKILKQSLKSANALWSVFEDSKGFDSLPKYLMDNQTVGEAVLEDYVFSMWAFYECFLSSNDFKWLERAEKIRVFVVEKFVDEKSGRLFLSKKKDTRAVRMHDSGFDSALPSAVGIFSWISARIAHASGKMDVFNQVHNLISAYGGEIQGAPGGATALLMSMDYLMGKRSEWVLTGNMDSHEAKMFLRESKKRFMPRCLVLQKEEGFDLNADLVSLPDWIKMKKTPKEGVLFYNCHSFTCQDPMSKATEAMNLLE